MLSNKVIQNYQPVLTSDQTSNLYMLHINSDILLPSENYLLMLMFEVSLSLVYHVIRVTYVQFLTITINFCMEDCKRYLAVNRVPM